MPPYAVEKIKKRLSTESQVTAEILLITGKNVAVTCTRAELEKLLLPLLARARDLVDEALASVGWREGGVDRIIATGGPMLMPCVKQLLSAIADDMGADLHDSDPLTSVALGAASLAHIKRAVGLEKRLNLYESARINQKTVRKLQNCQAQGYYPGDMLESAPQAAPGLNLFKKNYGTYYWC